MFFKNFNYSSPKRNVKIFFINMVILFTLILVLELLLQILKPYDLYQRTSPNQIKNGTFKPEQIRVDWMRVDTTVGWVCSASGYLQFANKFYNANKVSYAINKEGYRNNLSFTDQITSNKKKIMLLGESFLFGVYVDYNSTLVGCLEKLDSNYQYYNFGIPGYGIDQMFMTFRKYFELINPDAIVLIYIDDDIPRILESYRSIEGLNKPSYKIFAEDFEYRVDLENNFFLKILDNSYVLNKFYQKYLDYFAVSFTKKIFSQIRKELKKNMIVIRWPRKEMLGWEKIDWYYDLSGYCAENDIRFINLADLFVNFSSEKIQSFYLQYDGHPSKEGNKYVAEKLYEKTKGLFTN